MKKILLTGGGTAGHVSLHQAIIPTLLKQGYDVHYIGSDKGIEKELITQAFPDVPFHAIASGKLRRYFSVQNFTDPLKVVAGVAQALAILKKVKPQIVFSKGGFVSVPVVIAAKIAGIPVVSHESDVTPGLANKIALPFASHVFTVFQETVNHLPTGKATCTGAVIREELLSGNRLRGMERCHFLGNKPVLLVMGGSLGSVVLNDALRNNLPALLKIFDIIHLCGKGNIDVSLEGLQGYRQFDYVTTELPDYLHAADIIISRAGSNSIFEFLALHKPMLLIPLSAEKSRGDQILNANLFQKQGFAHVLTEEQVSNERLLEAIQYVMQHKEQMIQKMSTTAKPKTPLEMVEMVLKYTK